MLAVQPGSPAQLDRLDQMITDRYRWGFPVTILNMVYIGALLAVAMVGLLRRPEWLPGLRAPALAAPLIPVGIAVAGLVGTRSGIVYIALGFVLAGAVAYGATRLRRPEQALAAAMLAGAAILTIDTLTGAWLVRTSAYAFPVLTSPRFYGIGNEHMGYLLGLTAIGLAALWQLAPWRGAVFAAPAAAVTLVVGAPFWGANWGGAFSIAAGVLVIWLIAVPHRWGYAIPAAVGLLVASVAVPPALDAVASGTLARGTHIGVTAATVLSGGGAALGDIIARKSRLAVWVLLYTPWTLVLAVGTAAVLWLLLRRGAPARSVLEGRRQLAAGVTGALAGGIAATFVNDSGIVAGAGAFCAVLATAIFLAGSAAEAAR